MSENALIAASEEHSYGAPGHGLNGIRLTFAGMPATSRTSSRASAGLSLIPFNMTYSKVMRRAFAQRVTRDHHLRDDLLRPQITHQPLRAGVAKGAGQRTADLGGHAQGPAIILGNVNCLDLLAIAEA